MTVVFIGHHDMQSRKEKRAKMIKEDSKVSVLIDLKPKS